MARPSGAARASRGSPSRRRATAATYARASARSVSPTPFGPIRMLGPQRLAGRGEHVEHLLVHRRARAPYCQRSPAPAGARPAPRRCSRFVPWSTTATSTNYWAWLHPGPAGPGPGGVPAPRRTSGPGRRRAATRSSSAAACARRRTESAPPASMRPPLLLGEGEAVPRVVQPARASRRHPPRVKARSRSWQGPAGATGRW